MRSPSAWHAERDRPASLRRNDRSSDAGRRAHTLVAWSSSSLRSPRSQHVSASWASEVFCQHLLQRRRIEHRLRQQLLELAILVLERLEFARIGDLHPPEAGPPLVESCVADAMLAANVAG